MNCLYKLSSIKILEVNLVIVFYGVMMRVFFMWWFKWMVEQFEKLNNLKNCEVWVMEFGEGEEYSLLVYYI